MTLAFIPPSVLCKLWAFFLFHSFFYFLLVKDSRLSVSEQNSANWYPRFIPLFLKLPHLGREKELPRRLKLQAALSSPPPSDPLAHSHAISTDFSLNVKKKTLSEKTCSIPRMFFYKLSPNFRLATFQSFFSSSAFRPVCKKRCNALA